MDVAAWLRGLGLEQYAPAFRDNDVDGEVLPELTADDLISIGVTSVGHRRKLLAAIAALGAEPPTVAPSAPTSPATIEAERRQLTVMFCDLVGSTPLAARFDPEDLREIVGAYHRCVADTVGRFDGFVAKYMGDGVLIYFGYPQAHEDDAERAVRAGLAVIDAIGQLDVAEPLQVRLGVASGLVVVGDLVGEGAAQERGVVGETPNLAARLQVLTAPGTIVVADGTRRQLGGLFEIEDLGPQTLAGFAEVQRAWRIIGESGVVSRFEALRSGATPLVGRDEEVELLLRRWQQAKAGEGRVVLLSGEPGIGKSRLTAALLEQIAGEPHARLRYFCSPHHQDSTLYPFSAQLERAAGFVRDDSPEQKLEKLAVLLGQGAQDRHGLALIADLLSLPSGAAGLGLSPQRKREELFAALGWQLEALARHEPVLMVLEDAHWLDATSREMIELTLDRITRLPVLLVITCRPEFQHDWGGRPHVTLRTLGRLGTRDGAAMVERLVGNVGLPREIIDDIVERTDGVPLFVEELTKAVMETGGSGNRVEAVLAASPLPRLAVPAALHASLVARLDRLGPPAREVAQVGAVLGREFSYDLIARVAQRAEPDLQAALGRLTAAGLLFCRGVAPQSTYLFKHALIQDAAYDTLLRARRRELHRLAARTIVEEFAGLAEAQPVIVARHWTEAGDAEPALAAWRRAGDVARARSGFVEAQDTYRRALDVLAATAPSKERDTSELELLTSLSQAIWATKGWSAPEAVEVNARAQTLAEKTGHLGRLVEQQWAAWTVAVVSGDYGAMISLADQLRDAAQRDGSVVSLGLATNGQSVTRQFRGDFVGAERHFMAGAAFLAHPQLKQSFSTGFTIAIAGWTAWQLGRPDEARERMRRVFAAINDDAYSLASVQWMAACLHNLLGEPEQAAHLAAQAIALAAEHGFREVEPWARLALGDARARLGHVEEGINLIEESIAALRTAGLLSGMSADLTILAEAEMMNGALAEALESVEEALTCNPEERYYRPETIRLRGEIRRRQGDDAATEADFRAAIALAQEMSAKAWELRAAMSLARLWRDQARSAAAHDLLAPVYGWFTEGFDTADLQDAKALLDELA